MTHVVFSARKSASADKQFLIDVSGSMGAHHFNEEKAFVEGLARTFTIGPNNVQIGVAAFSKTVYEIFYMNSYTSQLSLYRSRYSAYKLYRQIYKYRRRYKMGTGQRFY